MKFIKTKKELREVLAGAPNVALVPTMGALHAGHLSLVEIARQHASEVKGLVAMSVFVNPLQFNSREDLEKYPRDIERDARMAKQAGVNIFFAPDVREMFPYLGTDSGAENSVRLRAGDLAKGLCGAKRPGHFDGVVTVVAALFNLFQPGMAVFGEKDFQQLRVIQQMVDDLHYQVEIVAGGLVREADGLAMSSRNERLSAAGRNSALAISRALLAARAAVLGGKRNVAELCELVKGELEGAGRIEVDYVEIVDVRSLEPLNVIEEEAQALVAAFVEKVRLIDNVHLSVR